MRSRSISTFRFITWATLTVLASSIATQAFARPRVIVISLDGATPRLVQQFIADGTIPRNKGLGLLARYGTTAERNITANPSLTAVAHVAIATGATAVRNDIPANTFHLAASPFVSTISGFGAPIGGYTVHGVLGPEETLSPTAEPMWLALRAAGKRVVTATFPGGDGVDVRVPGLAGSPIIQSAAKRTVDYTVPFGAFGGVGAQGITLGGTNFGPAPALSVASTTWGHFRSKIVGKHCPSWPGGVAAPLTKRRDSTLAAQTG